MKFSFSLSQIEYVLALHRHGHFAKAAEECGITQPTLSMQIQKLEDDLGVKIFDRSKKPILVTSLGKKIIEQMVHIHAEAKKVSDIIEVESGAHALEGSLKMGVIPTLAPYLLPLVVPALQKHMPKTRFKIIELQTHQITEALQMDEIDVGLLATPVESVKMFEYALFYEPFYVVCHKDHPLDRQKKVKYENLHYEDIWLLEEGHCLRHQILDICSLKKNRKTNPQFEFESGSLETIKSLIETVGGYSLIPHLALKGLGKNSHGIPFDRPIPAREVGLIYRREHLKIDLIEHLGTVILQSLPTDLQKLRRKDLDVIPVES